MPRANNEPERRSHPLDEGPITQQRFLDIERGHKELKAGHARLEKKLDENTKATKETHDSVRELVDWAKGFKFMWNLTEIVAKFLAYVGMVGAFFGGIWLAFKGYFK